MLQSISSGLLGADSYDGGISTAALGGALHFFIAFSAAAVYFAASRKIHILSEKPVISGLLYGVAVYAFMNFVVIPRSGFPHTIVYSADVLAIGLSVHFLCVGLPISLAISRS